MASISNEEIRAFSEGIEACVQRPAGGGVLIDTSAVRTLVRKYPAVAARYVELHCMAAVSNPSLIQAAFLVATAYQVELNDTALLQKVMETAKATGGEKWLKRMGGRTESQPLEQRPERQAAMNWWKANKLNEGRCDNCNRRVTRGEGFLITGRVTMLGDQRIEMGNELVCEDCFKEIT